MTGLGGATDPLANLSERIDYLQGQWSRQPSPLGAAAQPCTWAQSHLVSAIRGIGVVDKGKLAEARATPAPGKDDHEGRLSQALPRTADVLAGLHGRTGLAFEIGRAERGLFVRTGVWSSRSGTTDLADRQRMLSGLLAGCYTDVRSSAVSGGDPGTSAWSGAGYVIGVPDPAAGRPDDPATPMDRLIRALPNDQWSVVVVAQPIGEAGRRSMRDALLNEARLVHAAAGRSEPSPPVRAYLELLDSGLGAMSRAGAVGAWRTAVYLRGDSAGYARLAATWAGIFSGPYSSPLPIRVIDSPSVHELAERWALPDVEGPPTPSVFRYPFAAQTVLSSYQLAAYVHLPEQEQPGYAVEQVPVFDTWTREDPTGRWLALGHVVNRAQVTTSPYVLDPDGLTRHAFVSGVTGSGKTNTVVALLVAASACGAGFLVLEPAKTEYRALLSDPRLGADLRVFTAGDETISPLRINPLEVPPGTTVAAHIDLVRALFAVSFALWSPLPQILEQALHLAYQDRGWDVIANINDRIGGEGAPGDAFPTLTDLSERVDDVIDGSGYDAEALARVRGALSTKLSGLRVGGKGRMLDTTRSTDVATLFDRPAVIELEALGDGEDKAFLMGLLLIRLAEHRRAQGHHDGLRHLLVVEEAHRLLSAQGHGDKDFNGAGGKAVETFTDLLAEIRAYGQGLVIADQVPSRLAPEVIKNTGLKVTHRIVAEDDRRALGTSTAMTDLQMRSLATLAPAGRAAVFTEGEDAPVLIQVADVKAALAPISSADLRSRVRPGDVPGPSCCGQGDRAGCDRAAVVSSTASMRRRFSQIAVAVAANPISALHVWDDLGVHIREAFPSARAADPASGAWRCVVWRSTRALARRRGAQRRWSYAEQRSFADGLSTVVVAAARGDLTGAAAAAEDFAALSRRLFERDIDPFPGCAEVCPDRTCLFRPAVEDLLGDPALAQGAREALGTEHLRTTVWQLADQVTLNPLVDWPGGHGRGAADARRRAASCAAQLAFAKFTPLGLSPSGGIAQFLASERPPVVDGQPS